MTKTQISTRMTKDAEEVLNRKAEEQGISRSEVVRRLVVKGLGLDNFSSAEADSSKERTKAPKQDKTGDETEKFEVVNETDEKEQLTEEEAKKQLEIDKKEAREIFDEVMEENGVITKDMLNEAIEEIMKEKESQNTGVSEKEVKELISDFSEDSSGSEETKEDTITYPCPNCDYESEEKWFECPACGKEVKEWKIEED